MKTSTVRICADCGHKADVGDTFGKVGDMWYCEKNQCLEVAEEGYTDYLAEMDGPDPHGYRDPSPEQLAGEVFQDKYDMYRNEY